MSGKRQGGGGGGGGGGGMQLSKKELEIMQRNKWLTSIPMLSPSMLLPNAEPSLATFTEKIARLWQNDFSWSASFDPEFMSAVMREGYLPTAHNIAGPHGYVLLPKLHEQRSLMSFDRLNINRSTRRRAVDFHISVDKKFDEVVAACIRQHGESWLHPPIVEGFRKLFQMGGNKNVRMHSIECYEGDKLVAGELGYTAGRSYCSLTGFSEASSAGTVQLVCLGVHLRESGIAFWDLGMGMEYKQTLGAQEKSRMNFLEELHKVRDLQAASLAVEKTPASKWLRPAMRPCTFAQTKGGQIVFLKEWKAGKFLVHAAGRGDDDVESLWESELFCIGHDAVTDGHCPKSLQGSKRSSRREKKKQRPNVGAGGHQVSDEDREKAQETKLRHHRDWERCTRRREILRSHIAAVLKARAESGSSSKRGSKKLLKLEKALTAETAANSASAAS